MREIPQVKTSRNLLADILSKLTDVRQNSLEPILRGLDSQDHSDKNNPYYPQKNEIKVSNFLADKGIDV